MLKINRCRLFPILTFINSAPRKKNDYKILMEKASPGQSIAKAIALKQLGVLEGQNASTEKQAIKTIVNDLAMALRGVIVNTNNKVNPLREWKDANWFYKWIQEDTETCHCIVFCFIPVKEGTVTLQRPDKYFWKILEKDLGSLFNVANQFGQLVKLPSLSVEAMQRLIGDDLYDSNSSHVRPTAKCLRGSMEVNGTEREGQQCDPPLTESHIS